MRVTTEYVKTLTELELRLEARGAITVTAALELFAVMLQAGRVPVGDVAARMLGMASSNRAYSDACRGELARRGTL